MTTVSSGQTLAITAGQTSSGVIVDSGGTLNISSGGTAIGTVDSGIVTVSSGGVASGTIVSSGGDQYVQSHGSAVGTIFSGGFGEVFSGGSDSGTFNNGFVVINSGAVDTGTVVVGIGVEYTDGSVVNMVISSGGREYIYSGGIASNTVVSSGGYEFANSGGIDSGTTVSSGGVEYLYSGGIASATIVLSGGHGVVLSGGIASGMVVSRGGFAEVPLTSAYGQWSPSSASIVDGVTVQSGATVSLDIYKGGSISGFVALNGAYETVYSSGFTYSTLVSSGGAEDINGSDAAAYYTVVSSGGYQEIYSGGLAYDPVINSAATQVVGPGGVTSYTQVNGGYEEVESGGVASITTVNGGGVEYVYSGGVASSGTVYSGGDEVIQNGAVASGTVVDSGGSVEVPLTSAFGQWSPNTANVIDGVTIQSGTNVLLDIYQGGSISGFRVLSGGGETINSGGVASGTVVSSGGSENISSGGVASGTVVSSGGSENIFSSGVAQGPVVVSGGTVAVYSGGAASGVAVGAGGFESVFSGGSANGSVASGGRAFVQNGGIASGTVVSGGGLIELPLTDAYGQWSPSGTSDIDGVSVQSGAAVSLDLYQGGTISGFLVLSGASENISSGGIAYGTVVSSGGTEDVYSGGVASGAAVNGSGAVLGLLGGVVSGAITFGGSGGQLLIAGTTMPTNTISGFVPGDSFDLAGVPLDATSGSANLTSGNVLQITESGTTYDLNLDPAQSFAGDFFNLASDSGSGTLVTENQNPCFCRGTLILTDRGEVPVERLAVGDRVVTLSDACKPVVWIGFGRSLVTRRNSEARPIIVRRGALADNVPTRDLYLSHGHALYFDHALIPVEHLVNHRSVLWDEEARVVEYYHIELEDHEILFAEGAPAETYHDANNRAFFLNARPSSKRAARKPTFAPVLHDGDIVGKEWARLFARAGGAVERTTTDDPDLHLLVDGARIGPAAVEDGVYSFTVERPPAARLRLRSRSGVPSLLGLGRHDHRRLGVAIKQIILDQAGLATAFDYDAPQFREGGCHRPEDGYSWTDGEFDLPLRFFSLLNGPFTLAVHTKPHYDMRYPMSPRVARAA